MKKCGMTKIILIAIVFLMGCNSPDMVNTTNPNFVEIDFERAAQSFRGWYDRIIEGLQLDSLMDTINDNQDGRVISEFRVLKYVNMGYNYYSFQVFDDGLGKFTIISITTIHMEIVEVLLNETIFMNFDQTQKLRQIIEDNNFFDIPTIHPDEPIGVFGGYAVFIEGYDNGNLHFISMSCDGLLCRNPSLGIFAIYRAFRDFASEFVEIPRG